MNPAVTKIQSRFSHCYRSKTLSHNDAGYHQRQKYYDCAKRDLRGKHLARSYPKPSDILQVKVACTARPIAWAPFPSWIGKCQNKIHVRDFNKPSVWCIKCIFKEVYLNIVLIKLKITRANASQRMKFKRTGMLAQLWNSNAIPCPQTILNHFE